MPEQDSLRLNGSIRVILTWNLCERAFLVSDGSRTRYPLLRGSGEFAKFVRDLGKRFTNSGYFILDSDNEVELSHSYAAGLISQYAAEYELNATFRVKEDKKAKDFLPERLESVTDFVAAWEAWPIKRFRISRYGFLQVILETKEKSGPERFVSRTRFLEPIKLLHKPMKLAKQETGHDWRTKFLKAIKFLLKPMQLAKQEIGHDWTGRPELTVNAQWEILGSLLSRIIEVIESQSQRARKDLVRFDPAYRFSWREKEPYAAGTSLPLRTEYTILWIRKVTLAEKLIEPEKLTKKHRQLIASLLEEVPWVEEVSWKISPQRPKTIRGLLRQDEATWNGEMCLLSFGTAVLTTLHPLYMGLPRGSNYQNYWKAVRRVIEYFAELRLLAWLVERQSADLFEYMLRDLATKGRLRSYEERVRSRAALSGLANRLRVAASADTIAQNGAILTKVERLRAIFEIGRSLEHADRNLSATQDLITSTESQQNEKGILLLTAGLAGFTAILMGLALPTYFEHSHKLSEKVGKVGLLSFLRRIIPIEKLVFTWANFSVFLTVLALLTALVYVAKFFRVKELAKKIWLFLSTG
ncbi:MAG: hypothetical protein WAM82_34055 [Thermoanaerobaculia bacterium]